MMMNLRTNHLIFSAKERAKNASIVIVNHAFLTADFKKGRKAIPPSRQIIVDEAHQFENVTRNQLSNQIDYISTLQLFQSLARIGMGEVIETAKVNADSFLGLFIRRLIFFTRQRTQYQTPEKSNFLLMKKL